MTTEDLATGQQLQQDIADITAIQEKIAESDASATLQIVKDGQVYVSGGELFTLLGSAYTTLVATAKTSLNSALASAKSTKETAFDDLGT